MHLRLVDIAEVTTAMLFHFVENLMTGTIKQYHPDMSETRTAMPCPLATT